MQSNANAGVQRDWDFCTAMKAKICRKDSLRGPVEFRTRRGLQSGSKLTRSKDGSEMEFSGALPPPLPLKLLRGGNVERLQEGRWERKPV